MKISLIILLLIVCFTADAQRKPRFSTQNSVGLLVGEAESGPVIETINGFVYRNWFAGIGSGIDWYYLRSVPLFFSASRFVPMKANRRIQFSSGVGMNFPWASGRDMISNGWFNYSPDYKNGLYWNAGFGYRIGIGKHTDNLLVHLGYNNKSYKQEVRMVYPCLVPPCPENVETFKYSLNSLSLRFGWGF